MRVQGYECLGTLRFLGEHQSKPGIRCGVALDQPIGINDGTVKVQTSKNPILLMYLIMPRATTTSTAKPTMASSAPWQKCFLCMAIGY